MPAALVAATLVTVSGSSVTASPPAPALRYAFPAPDRPIEKAKPKYDPHSVLVKFKAKSSTATREKALTKVKGRKAAASSGDYTTVTSDAAAPELLKKLEAEPSVELASLNYVRKAVATPNDTYYGSDQAYLSTIRMPQAWDITKTAGTQTVAVLDSGVDGGHQELTGRVLAGYNAIQPGAPTTDDYGHGTMVAGIIAANTNNGVGMAGVAWNAKVLPVKVLDGNGNGNDASIIAGIDWAASHGARVINLSLGGEFDNEVLHDAVKNAVAKGIVVVASSGNDYNNVPWYPAAYPESISVGATDNSGALTTFSSWGDTVDITAPGWHILSTGPRSFFGPGEPQYLIGSGTSFSAPMVAAVAALVRNKYPSYTPAQVAARLKSTARDAGPRGIDPFYGAGLLDANDALGGWWAPELWVSGPDGNDVPARATALTTPSITDTIRTEGEEDWYSTQSEAARNVVVTVTPPAYDDGGRSQNLDPMLTVYDDELRVIGFSDTSADKPESVSVTLPAGRSYIQVRNYNGSRDSRPYTLAVANTGSGGALAGQRLWVRDTAPADLSSAIPQDFSPSFTMERELDPASIDTTTVRLLHGKTGAVVPSTATYDATTKKLTIDPTDVLQDNTPYRAEVTGVKDTGGETMSGSHIVLFRTFDIPPPPATNLTVTGGYGTAALKWTLPTGITDLDQIVVRRNVGTTAPTTPATGTSSPGSFGTGTTATGLASSTSYAFSAWARDRSGKLSAPVQVLLTGTTPTIASTTKLLTYGTSPTLSGKLQRIDTKGPVAGVPMALWGRNKNSSTWREITRVTTSATGTYSVTYNKLPVSTIFVWRYNGSAGLQGSQSGYLTVEVKPTIAVYLAPTAIKLGASTTIYGYVRPQNAGSPVYLQRLNGSTWTTISGVKLNSTGNYGFTIKPTARGTYTYRIVFQADGDNATNVSATKTFTVS